MLRLFQAYKNNITTGFLVDEKNIVRVTSPILKCYINKHYKHIEKAGYTIKDLRLFENVAE